MKTLLIVLGLAVSASAATVTVPAGGDLQAALNNASLGDTIVLSAGAVYPTSGGFVLPNKLAGSGYITIQSSALSGLPPLGYRVHPTDVGKMATLVSLTNGAPVIRTALGAHHVKLVGLEISVSSGVTSNGLVQLGQGTETLASDLPHDLVVDRCYIHGDPTAGTKRGVALECSTATVVGSYISEIHVVGQDAQAIGSFNGSGPFTIVNNELQAATENILIGGSDPAISGGIPSDIVITGNHFYKPLSWKGSDPSYSGIHWSVKNIFELKNAQRVLVSGNVFENCWADAQVGFAIALSPRNQGGSATWCTVQDVEFSHNIIRHSASGFNLLSTDDTHVSQPMRNISIHDNIVDDINRTVYGGDGRMILFNSQASASMHNLSIVHNTLLHVGSGNSFGYVGDHGTFSDSLDFSHNILTHGSYGFIGGGFGQGTVALNGYMSAWTFVGNVIAGGGSPSAYPTGNFFVGVSSIGFVAPSDYHLASTVPYVGAGADVNAVLDATCGAVSGLPASVCNSSAPVPLLPCDVSGDGASNVGDVQSLVNGLLTGTCK